MINFLRYRYEPGLNDEKRLQLCISYFCLIESGYIDSGTDDVHKFVSLMGRNEQSIMYRINKKRK